MPSGRGQGRGSGMGRGQGRGRGPGMGINQPATGGTSNMKVCVTSTGSDLDSQVDPRFGRCQYFMIIDLNTLQHQAVNNPNVAGGGGVGINSAQLMVKEGVQEVLTGTVGPNAVRVLNTAGIKITSGVTGTVRDVVAQHFNKKI